MVSATVVRPNDTIQYAAGDQVADSTTEPTPITFAGVARANGRSGYIIQALCIDSANQAIKPNLELYLFNVAPTPNNDNAAWTPSDADMLNVIGVIEFNVWKVGNAGAGAAGNCVAVADLSAIPFRCGAAVDDLYGLLVERGTYTPVAEESFKVVLGVLQD